MEIKKAPRADLQRYRTIFLLCGMIIAIGVCLIAFNWKSSYELDQDITNAPVAIVEQEEIPMTQQEEQKPDLPKPEAPKIITRINIVQREVKLDSEVDPFDTEMDENTAVDPIEYTGDSGEKEVEEEEIFYFVEEMPSFQGGDLNKFRDYVQSNCKYPEAATETGIQGKVQVAFVVEPNGTVSNVRVLRGVDPLLDKEAVRVIKNSPKWTPGKQRGKPARVGYTIPVVFFLH